MIGGLGNQMFQFATGRALSLRLNKRLYLDISDFENYDLHNGFEIMKVFSVNACIAMPSDLKAVLGFQSNKNIKSLLSRRKLSLIRSRRYIVESSLHDANDLFKVDANAYLYGYWQNPNYFSEFEMQIRKDLIFQNAINAENLGYMNLIKNKNSVAIHVRRGDYVSNPIFNSAHGVCSADYYNKAISLLSRLLPETIFFVFSDDIEWAKNNLIFNSDQSRYFITGNNGANAWMDLQLMSNCKHNIISNSTFSWWGAWLNSNPDKIVISPRYWFNNFKSNNSIVPNGWIQL